MDYDKVISRAANAIPPSGIRRFFDIVEDDPDAISLGVGEPDFVTPWEIRDAAIKSVQKGYTAYTSNSGLKKLRAAICDYQRERFCNDYGESEVLVTVGASEAIDLSLRAVINPGDEVLIPDPSYVSYRPNVTLVGGVPVPVATSADNGFKLLPCDLSAAVTPKTKAVILPYPNNPTGAVLSGGELNELSKVIIERNLMVISDEIYAELTYNGRHVSAAAVKDMKERTVLISGFSKAFAMTGWRVGYVCAPQPIIKAMTKIHQYAIMCAPTVGQYAALAALQYGRQTGYESVEEMKNTYDMRRRLTVAAFNEMGLECAEPQGAFYAFPSVRSLGVTGAEFAEMLLKTKHVAVVPGDSFGECGVYHVRCSYATGTAQLTEALRRIAEFAAELK